MIFWCLPSAACLPTEGSEAGAPAPVTSRRWRVIRHGRLRKACTSVSARRTRLRRGFVQHARDCVAAASPTPKTRIRVLAPLLPESRISTASKCHNLVLLFYLKTKSHKSTHPPAWRTVEFNFPSTSPSPRPRSHNGLFIPAGHSPMSFSVAGHCRLAIQDAIAMSAQCRSTTAAAGEDDASSRLRSMPTRCNSART